MKENKYRDHYCGKLNNNDIEMMENVKKTKEQEMNFEKDK